MIAVGLFLIVGLFGWQTYLEKSAKKNRIDERGVPASVRDGVLKHQKAAQEKAKKPVEAPSKSKTDESGEAPSKSKTDESGEATKVKAGAQPKSQGEAKGAETQTPSKPSENDGDPAKATEAK